LFIALHEDAWLFGRSTFIASCCKRFEKADASRKNEKQPRKSKWPAVGVSSVVNVA